MEYSKITNPLTGRLVSINGVIGKKVLSSYINFLNGGGSNCTKYHDDPIKCQSSKDKTGNYCVYSAARYRGDVGQCRKSTARDIEKAKESARRRKQISEKFQTYAAKRVQKRYRSKKRIDRLAQSAEDMLVREKNKKALRMSAQIATDLRKSKARKSAKSKLQNTKNKLKAQKMFTDSGNTRRIRNIKKNREINEESRENSAKRLKCSSLRKGKCRENKRCMLTKGKKKKCVPCDFNKHSSYDACLYR